MSALKELYGFFTDNELVIPAIQMIFYMIVINMLMLFNSYKTCFLVSLSFAFYWMFILNKALFVDTGGNVKGGIFLYLGAGILFILAMVITFLRGDN